jgi:hypothetical protein
MVGSEPAIGIGPEMERMEMEKEKEMEIGLGSMPSLVIGCPRRGYQGSIY